MASGLASLAMGLCHGGTAAGAADAPLASSCEAAALNGVAPAAYSPRRPNMNGSVLSMIFTSPQSDQFAT